jgi:flagellar motor switch protein FliG
MGNEKSNVITVYGHNKTIDRIAVSLFDRSGNSHDDTNATTYCDTINTLELKGDLWIYARIVSENTQYSLDTFLPLNFSDIIMKLDNPAIQRILREVDSQELVKALKGENEAVKEKIFNNMTKRAAQMLKEDMECMGPIRTIDVKENQEKILSLIKFFEQCGEIAISYDKGETRE